MAGLAEQLAKLQVSRAPSAFQQTRRFATETTQATTTPLIRTIPPPAPAPKGLSNAPPAAPEAITTVYKFPTMEPLSFQTYNTAFLQTQIRRDILHKAVIYEGDNQRLGRGRTQTRSDVHGSGRKLRPQKGTGKARLGDKSSPMLRGGIKAHGPKAEKNFATDLQSKVYSHAYRIAFSYRYKCGELIVVDDISDHEFPDAHYVKELLKNNNWGRENKNTLFLSMRPNASLIDAIERMETEGRAMTVEEVDCKNLLELGRIVIEKEALDYFFDRRCPPEVRI
ncbi:ribosomal protein L4 domain-containing protein [Peziza echinospora]|nr:ribosomal protein L4 domain-containing protein [Peziza echinospora]